MADRDLHVSCDVLVVGGGITAVFAACKARELGLDVVLADKAHLGRSGCTALASGVFHYYTREDDEQAVLRGLSGPITNHQLLKETIYETHDALKFLDQAGVKFVKEGAEIVRVGGPRMPFPHSAMLGKGGPQLGLALRAESLRRGVRVFNRVMITGLLTSDGQLPTAGRVIGAVGFGTRTGQCHVFRARAVIMCCGPYGIPYNRHDLSFFTRSMPIDASAEGIYAMYQAGAVLGKLEMGYRTPGPPEFTNAPGLEMFTALGGHSVWMNRLGERFLTEEFRRRNFGRSSITVSILQENFQGRGPAGINLSNLTADQRRLLAQVIPIIMANYESAGYDLTRDTIPYSIGAPGGKGVNGAGARINARGETSVPGLFAAGNCSDGAYVCLGQALDTCAVTGWWAARGAADQLQAGVADPSPLPDQVEAYRRSFCAPTEVGQGLSFEQVRDQLTDIQISLTPTLNDQNLSRAIGEVQRIMAEDAPRLQATDPRELSRVNSLRYTLPILELVLHVMRHRTESRGNLMRDDYPEMDNDRWLCHTVLQRQDVTDFRLWDIPIPADWWLFPPPGGRSLHPYFVNAGGAGSAH